MSDMPIAESVALDAIRSRILTIRGVQVMLDRDLAELYGVPTKALNQAVKRNIERFPERFMFHLGKEDIANLRLEIVDSRAETSLRSQIVTLNTKQGQPSSRCGCGEVQRAAWQHAHGQGDGELSRPFPHHRQVNSHSCRCVAQLPWQKVLRVRLSGQVQHPRYPDNRRSHSDAIC